MTQTQTQCDALLRQHDFVPFTPDFNDNKYYDHGTTTVCVRSDGVIEIFLNDAHGRRVSYQRFHRIEDLVSVITGGDAVPDYSE